MQQASPAARIRQRDTFYKAQDLNSGQYLQFRENGSVRLTDAGRCTWFHTHAQAEAAVSARLGACAVEIERCDT